MINRSVEPSALSKERRAQTLLEATMVVAGLFSFFTGGSEAKSSVATTVEETPIYEDTSEPYTLTSDIAGWVFECSGVQTKVVDANDPASDTLYDLIANNVAVTNSVRIGTPDVPPLALADAIAPLSAIEDVNYVQDGQEITLPLSCQPSVLPG